MEKWFGPKLEVKYDSDCLSAVVSIEEFASAREKC